MTEFLALESSNSAILSATTAAAANPARQGFKITNCGQSPLFVKEGAGASVTDFSYLLAGGTANDDGTGGSYESQPNSCYTGIITIAGTSPRYVITQRQNRV